MQILYFALFNSFFMQIFYFQIAGTNENVVYFWGTRYVSPYTSRPSTRDLFGQRSDPFARQLFNLTFQNSNAILHTAKAQE